MNSQTKHTIKTEEAWKNLHSRLEKDGLLNEETISSAKKTFHIPYWQWAAIVLFIGCSLVLLLQKKTSVGNPELPLITVWNEPGTGTLVKTLEDGSVIYLADNTELSFPEHFAKEKREVSLLGNAFFDVQGDKKHPFLIQTNQTEIEVIGTSFEVKSTDGENFELSVLEGTVKVRIKETAEDILINKGEAISVNSTGKWEHISPAAMDLFYRITEILRFKEEEVGNIIRIMNKRGSEKQLMIDPSLEKQRLTVAFSGQTPEEVATVLSYALHVNYKQDGNKLIIAQ